MSHSNLQRLFDPRSIAVIGASNRLQSAGNVLMRNLLDGGFAGPIMPVNPKHEAVAGVLTYPDVASLPRTPDLAIICTQAPTVPRLIGELGERGTKAAVVLADGLTQILGDDGKPLQATMLREARKYGLRILGGGTIGLLVPKANLNASFTHLKALQGSIAFVSQSGALSTLVLDWAMPKRIGFSHFISIGDGADIDFGDVLDYLGGDPKTRAILLYIESIAERRNFMAAARAAARNKPVLAVKAGRVPPGLESANLHFGKLVDSDDVFGAALQRAGILRVDHIDELFGAVETLARARPMRGERLVVLTNGGGTGTMAVDELLARGSKLAPLSETTIEKLNGLLPKGWSGGNPVEILVDAPPSRYSDALRVLAEDKSIDAVLALHAPTALTSNEEIAKAIVQTARKHGANLLTSWVGEESVAAARRHFVESGLPTFESPSAAVRAFLHMVKHRRNMEMLMQTPPSSPTDFRPDIPAARAVIDKALADGRSILSEPEAKEILSAFGMPTTPTRIVASPEEAEKIADEIGYPIALTILSPDITRKWDVGGVALTLENAEAVRAACQGMITRLEERSPGARHTGFTVQRMVPRKNARQLIIGVATDPLFGPVILFGEGGRAIEVIRDHAVALPPLNVALAKELIGRTRVSALLEAYHDRPAADLDAIALALMQVSQIVIDLPEIIEIDVNPLFADNKGVMVVDAHMRITPAPQGPGRLAIRPYPKELEEEAQLKDGRKIMLRPIRPEDEPAHHVMVARMSPEDLRMRFFNYVTELPHSQMARLTQIDYEREMAFIATLFNEMGEPETLAVVRTVTDPDNLRAEFAVAVRSDMKGQGLGRLLMEKIVRHAKARGTNEIAGDILAENKNMLALAGRLGFVVGKPDEDNVVKVVCSLL